MRALVLAALLAASPSAAGETAKPRLIVLISVDTLRADRLREDLTPRLSAFARRAAAFPETAQATWTLPSHASMLTSLLPRSHGAGGDGGGTDWRGLSAGARSVAQELKDAGWRTEAVVSSPVLDAQWGFARGFGSYRRASFGERGEERAFDDAAAAVKRAGREPLFLFVHSNLVHSYGRQRPSSVDDGCPLTEEQMLPALAMRPGPKSPGSEACAVDVRGYERAVRCMDRAAGRFLDAVAASPAGKDALIVFTSDHGEALCDVRPSTPLRGHGYPGYAEQVEVPLLIRPPGGAAAARPVAARELDVAPTILDYAGVPAPQAFQGRSLRPAVEGAALEPLPSPAEGDDWASLRSGDLDLVRRGQAPARLYRGLREVTGTQEGAPGLSRALDAALDAAPRAPAAAPAAVDARLDEALKAEGYRK